MRPQKAGFYSAIVSAFAPKKVSSSGGGGLVFFFSSFAAFFSRFSRAFFSAEISDVILDLIYCKFFKFEYMFFSSFRSDLICSIIRFEVDLFFGQWQIQ